MLNLHEVYVFLIAAETENFSETGRRLNISQPAVSMQIRSLEETLGMDLFYRSGRHISLTEAGRALVPMARDLVSRAIRIEEEMACLRGKIVGVLRLAYSMASGKYIIPRLVAGLRSQHPDVQIVCSVAPRDQSLQMLLNGEVHIAITNLREPSKDIEYRPFATDRIILIAPPGHPWAQRRVIEPADLTECDLILQDEGSGTREALKDKLAWHNLSLDSLRTVMVLSNTEAIRIAVEEGIGAAFVSAVVAAEGIRAGRLVPVTVNGLELAQTLYLARHTGRPATGAQAAFWDYAFAPENASLRALTNRPVIASNEDGYDTPDVIIARDTH